MAFVIMFAIGPGSIPWFLVTELLPPSAQPLASSICVAASWLCNIGVSLVFPILMVCIVIHRATCFIECQPSNAFKAQRPETSERRPGTSVQLTVSSIEFQVILAHNTFLVFTVLLAFFYVYIYRKLPETRGRTLVEITSHFTRTGEAKNLT